MSDWSNLEDIMRDLSVAQGYTVPATLDTYAASGPPPLNIEEETEEAYYESELKGAGDFAQPDFAMIQQMLNLVKEKKDEEGYSPEASCDLDPYSSEFVPKQMQKKIEKNVALSSIIMAKEAELSAKRPAPKAVIQTMFKKKSPNKTEKIKSVSPPNVSSPVEHKQYTPSTLASEYYNKYLQKSQFKEDFKTDIWARAERKMKEIDDRKKREAELSSPEDRDKISSPEVAYAFDVHLPEHRHLMPGDCIVCIVAAKHGFYF